MLRPREHCTDWQGCKNASQEIIQQLWKLRVKPLALNTTEPALFPKKIDCEDHCDPESLGNDNKMHCLQKISQGLHHYHTLLGLYSQAQNITDLRSALEKLSCLLQKDPDITERIHPSKNNTSTWEQQLLQQDTLWRLQSFSVVVARVFAHSAALNVKIQQ
uniref:interleukin-23 subunit alpha n=1 Tax=Euleptes europaea TaxID=460621 RepID=UPI002540ADA8|nr:interleukin-23 subunit alpha [Euleptes europaea]